MKEGGVAGNIVHNGYLLHFSYSKDYTYSGVISGTGDVIEDGAEGTTLTLNGANTYTGQTLITNTLALGVNGSIEHSSRVGLMTEYAKLDIRAGNKKVKGLSTDYPGGEVLLGSNTLTIGTPGQNDGGGRFLGKFISTEKLPRNTNSVVKTGKGFFFIESQYGTNGTFMHEEGSVSFAGSWAGHYTKAADAFLIVRGPIQFQGNLNLSGGHISMNLTLVPLPGIRAWDVPATGVNALLIASGPVPRSELIRTTMPNGVLSLEPYVLSMADIPGHKARLSIEGAARQLMLLIEKV